MKNVQNQPKEYSSLPAAFNQISGPKSSVQSKLNLRLNEIHLKEQVSPGNGTDTS